MDHTPRRARAEQIARRIEQLATGQPVTRDYLRGAAEHNEDAYDSAAAAHERASRAHDRAAERQDQKAWTHQAAAEWHRACRDADIHAGRG